MANFMAAATIQSAGTLKSWKIMILKSLLSDYENHLLKKEINLTNMFLLGFSVAPFSIS